MRVDYSFLTADDVSRTEESSLPRALKCYGEEFHG